MASAASNALSPKVVFSVGSVVYVMPTHPTAAWSLTLAPEDDTLP